MKEIIKLLYRFIPFKKYLFLFVKLILKLPKEIYCHLYFHGVFTIDLEGRQMKMYHFGQELENEIFWNGLSEGWEKESLKIWQKLSKESRVILDIGSNSGVYALISETVNPNGQVFAFEPVKRVFQKLEKNISLNKLNIKAFELALSNKDGEATIYDKPTDHIYSVTVNQDTSANKSDSIPVKINIQRLDSFIESQDLDSIDLMKLDVEFHEPEVLEGMGHYLKKFRPAILVEILTDETGERVEEYIDSLNYVYYNIDEDLGPMRQERITSSKGYNFLLLPSERSLN